MKITKGDYQTAMEALHFICEQGRPCILYISQRWLMLSGLISKRFDECWDNNTIIGIYDSSVNIRHLQADIIHGLKEVKKDYQGVPAKIGQTSGIPYGGLSEYKVAL